MATRSPGRITFAAFTCALLVLSLACAKPDPNVASQGTTTNAAANAPDETIATVNERPVSRKLYEMFLRNGREALGIREDTEEGRRKLEELREGIMSELIDRALITQEATRRGLSLTPERFGQIEQREIAKLGGDTQFAEYLRTHNLTRDEYRASIRDMAYGELMTEEATRQATVSDEEIKTYYETRLRAADPSLRLPERIKAAHILFNARPQAVAQQLQRERNLTGAALQAAVREETARLRARASELRREAARPGADFAQLAREHSQDAATRERGGDLGTFARGAHTPAFDDAAFRLKPGEVSEVIETEYGYHIIKLTGREPARAVTLEEATPDIRTRLLAQKQARLLSDWLSEARVKAQVRIQDPYRFGALKTKFPN